MKIRSMRILLLTGTIFILLADFGCTHLNSGRESAGGEAEKKDGGKILCVDEEGMQVSFSNFWRAVKNIFRSKPGEEEPK